MNTIQIAVAVHPYAIFIDFFEGEMLVHSKRYTSLHQGLEDGEAWSSGTAPENGEKNEQAGCYL